MALLVLAFFGSKFVLELLLRPRLNRRRPVASACPDSGAVPGERNRSCRRRPCCAAPCSGLVALILLAVAADVLTYDPQPWLADYTRLKRDMAQGYANLDWIGRETRRRPARAGSRRPTAGSDNAHSRVRAFLALRDFVRGFNDPHFRMKPGERPVPTPTAGRRNSGRQRRSRSTRLPAPIATPRLRGRRSRLPLPVRTDGRLDAARAMAISPAACSATPACCASPSSARTSYLAACQAVFKPGIGDRALQLAVRARQQALLREAHRRTAGQGRASPAGRCLRQWRRHRVGQRGHRLMTDKPMTRREALRRGCRLRSQCGLARRIRTLPRVRGRSGRTRDLAGHWRVEWAAS